LLFPTVKKARKKFDTTFFSDTQCTYIPL